MSDREDADLVTEESMFIPLSSISTIRQLYVTSALKTPAHDKVRYKPNASLLDRISIFQGDITKLQVDAIVNAANKSLLGGGGVDGAIHLAAGRQLVEECRGLNGCTTGQSKITRGYNLPARHIIHTVGPMYSSVNNEEKAQQLASCYRSSLEVAVENSVKHVAFPSVSTGIYGYPIVDATRIALDEVRRFCDAELGRTLDRIVFVVWSDRDKSVYESLITEYFPPFSTEQQEIDNAV